jgi:hypothetical protein
MEQFRPHLDKLYEESKTDLLQLLDVKEYAPFVEVVTHHNKEKWMTSCLDEIKNRRYYKILQKADHGIPQPFGGFDTAGYTEEVFKREMRKVVQLPNSFAICSEPPTEKLFENEGLFYQHLGETGILSSTPFQAVVKEFLGPDGTPLVSVDGYTYRYTCFTLSYGDNSVTCVNWHANSKGTTFAQLKVMVDCWRKNDIDVLMGDSNLTQSKLNSPYKIPLLNMFNGLDLHQEEAQCSQFSVSKSRMRENVIGNNQVTKGAVKEVDGQFYVKKDKGKTSFPLIIPIKNTTAFTPYTETNPVIADHSVLFLPIKNFNLFVVNTGSAGDPEKGFSPKAIWEGVNLTDFFNKVGQPYTKLWRRRFRTFFYNTREYLDDVSPKEMEEISIWLLKGGRTRRKRTLRKKTKNKYI